MYLFITKPSLWLKQKCKCYSTLLIINVHFQKKWSLPSSITENYKYIFFINEWEGGVETHDLSLYFNCIFGHNRYPPKRYLPFPTNEKRSILYSAKFKKRGQLTFLLNYKIYTCHYLENIFIHMIILILRKLLNLM